MGEVWWFGNKSIYKIQNGVGGGLGAFADVGSGKGNLPAPEKETGKMVKKVRKREKERKRNKIITENWKYKKIS